MKGHINLTGGEPLCNPYLFKILDLIKEDSDLITFSLLTNGTLVTPEIAKRLNKSPKAIDNTIQRIKVKIKNILDYFD